MEKKLFKFELIGFIFTGILGTLNHFLFEWLNNSVFIGTFCPVNESIWEHQKLLFFPYAIWLIIEYFILKKPKNFFLPKLAGITCGIIFTTAFYYTYTGIFGKESMVLDIISFFLGIGAAFLISYLMIKNLKNENKTVENISVFLLIFIGILFVAFTFSPPFIPLFKDPVTSTYGI